MKKAFTLIELLVVVLIIGILAAIALPQYQVAVTKARMVQAVTTVTAMRQASIRYQLSNGKYATDFRDLDISFNCDSLSNDGNRCNMKRFFCYLSDAIDSEGNRKPTAYCNYDNRIIYTHSPTTDIPRCMAVKTSSIANQVCKALGGTYESEYGGETGNNVYRIKN